MHRDKSIPGNIEVLVTGIPGMILYGIGVVASEALVCVLHIGFWVFCKISTDSFQHRLGVADLVEGEQRSTADKLFMFLSLVATAAFVWAVVNWSLWDELVLPLLVAVVYLVFLCVYLPMTRGGPLIEVRMRREVRA